MDIHIIAAQFTIVKLWNQVRCLSMDEGIKKMWCVNIHNGVLFSHQKIFCHLQENGWNMRTNCQGLGGFTSEEVLLS